MYRRYNHNPDGNRTIDCTVRAIALAADQSWERAYTGIGMVGLITHDMPESNSVWGGYLYLMGFRRMPLDAWCGECVTVRDFCRAYPYGTYVLALHGHVVCAIDGDYYDTWDSGEEPVLYVWHKEVS